MNTKISYEDVKIDDKVFTEVNGVNEYVVVGIGKEGNDNSASVTQLFLKDADGKEKAIVVGKDLVFKK